MIQSMKLLFLFLALTTFSNCLSAYEVSEFWNDKNQKMVKLSCSEDEVICESLCDHQSQCLVPEPSCVDCVGTSIYMTFLFQEMGRYIRSTSQEWDEYSFIELLKEGRFISLSSKSVYNHVDSFNSPALQRRFGSLCPDSTPTPVVFFEQQNSSKIGNPLMVWCESGLFEVENKAEIESFFSPLH